MDLFQKADVANLTLLWRKRRLFIRQVSLCNLIGTASCLMKSCSFLSSGCRCETLSSRFINSVKVGSGPEAAQGARALGLLAFTVGAGSNAQKILSDATPHLWKVARIGPSIAARSSVRAQLFMLGST